MLSEENKMRQLLDDLCLVSGQKTSSVIMGLFHYGFYSFIHIAAATVAACSTSDLMCLFRDLC